MDCFSKVQIATQATASRDFSHVAVALLRISFPKSNDVRQRGGLALRRLLLFPLRAKGVHSSSPFQRKLRFDAESSSTATTTHSTMASGGAFPPKPFVSFPSFLSFLSFHSDDEATPTALGLSRQKGGTLRL